MELEIYYIYEELNFINNKEEELWQTKNKQKVYT